MCFVKGATWMVETSQRCLSNKCPIRNQEKHIPREWEWKSHAETSFVLCTTHTHQVLVQCVFGVTLIDICRTEHNSKVFSVGRQHFSEFHEFTFWRKYLFCGYRPWVSYEIGNCSIAVQIEFNYWFGIFINFVIIYIEFPSICNRNITLLFTCRY